MNTYEQIKFIESRICRDRDLINSIKVGINESQDILKKLAATAMDVNHETIVLGFHLCQKSPTDKCIYKVTDTCWDDCVFCGHPSERK